MRNTPSLVFKSEKAATCERIRQSYFSAKRAFLYTSPFLFFRTCWKCVYMLVLSRSLLKRTFSYGNIGSTAKIRFFFLIPSLSHSLGRHNECIHVHIRTNNRHALRASRSVIFYSRVLTNTRFSLELPVILHA